MSDKQSIIKTTHLTNGTVKYLCQYPDGFFQGLFKGVDTEKDATLFTYEVALEIVRFYNESQNIWVYEII